MLMYEWGITWQEFVGMPDEVIERMKIFMSAKDEGMKRKQSSIDRDIQLQKQKSNQNG